MCRESDEVLNAQAGLTEEQKVIVEVFDIKPTSVGSFLSDLSPQFGITIREAWLHQLLVKQVLLALYRPQANIHTASSF